MRPSRLTTLANPVAKTAALVQTKDLEFVNPGGKEGAREIQAALNPQCNPKSVTVEVRGSLENQSGSRKTIECSFLDRDEVDDKPWYHEIKKYPQKAPTHRGQLRITREF
ncbi:hypothetical protein CR513_54630, partial [Mucuna pruriens]